jgi:outer membrane protein OmpA-like peptidoglycan-associated protein
MKLAALFLSLAGMAVVSAAQQSGPLSRVTLVVRTTKAINYRHLSGPTKIDFRGTVLQSQARGEARVESRRGAIRIQAQFEKVEPASRFGSGFLTYVLWAISPEGRADNLGELILDGQKSKVDVTEQMQAFALIVTAEPYFAVSQPSEVVVIENVVRPDTVGSVEEMDAKFDLLERGQYETTVQAGYEAPGVSSRIPLSLLEARNALQIVKAAGAERYSAESYKKAAQLLQTAEGYLTQKREKKTIETAAREAIQTAEDARTITMKRRAEERLAQERQAAADREAQAKAQAEASERGRLEAQLASERAAREKAEADAARAAALVQQQAAQAETEKARQAAEQAARQQAEAEAARATAQAQQQAAQADTEKARLAAEQARQAADQAARQQAEAEAARATAQAQQQAAQADADRARKEAEDADRARQQAEAEKGDLRKRLLDQLNSVLQTRDSARGLIVNMSDVLFDTAKYTLRPAAREKLAKISGIVLAHPGLNLKVEGHTDSVGSEEYNQLLSEQRASSVRDFLVQQGVSENSVTSRGFGKTQPAATNDTAEGRAKNRRVELVVTGDAIGGAMETESKAEPAQP